MILRNNKRYETNELFLNANWYEGEDNYVIDETKEENQELLKKIKEYSPYIDLVIKDGILVDVIPIERPEPEQTVPAPSMEERLESIELTLLELL